jgi:hypothetical protein
VTRGLAVGASLLAALVAAACADSEPTSNAERRHASPELGLSVGSPAGWTAITKRGALELAPEAELAGRAKHTIVIRAAERPRELRDGTPATRDGLVAATETALRAFPRAKLEQTRALEGTSFDGVRVSMTFVPRGLARTYRREHAMLIGKRLYHVMYTAPAGEPIDEDAFKTVLTTLGEGA